MATDWADWGVDLHLDVPAGGRRAGLERALRTAIRSGRLTPGSRLPATRTLAVELGIARNTVAAAYDQLVAEGYLTARTGSGTTVAALPPPSPVFPALAPAVPPRFDLRPGSPDVSFFPAAAWLRAARRALADAPAATYDYGDPRGHPALRAALADYLGRVRGVLAHPDRIVVTSGYVQALALLAGLHRVVAMEDPGLAFHRAVVRRAGARVVPLPVDTHGARTDLLESTVDAVVLTPANQFPLGAALAPARRRAVVDWGGLVIEDDYDGEFRYDRQPVGAVQGVAPEQVAYVGTAAKTLGPALRLGWVVLPERLVEPVVEAKRHTDYHTEVIGQLTLASLLTSHEYDRHVRAARSRYRARRDLLLTRLRGAPVRGVAAGLHALLPLPPGGPTEAEVLDEAARRGLALGDLGSHWHFTGDHPQGLIVGYGTPSESRYPAALDLLARLLTSVA
ncbi:GntR family transcriptional regulator [Asanoa ishikariensis]|uniref:Transcriptional regulator, GntR family n=1 Tax=Asanoa ishikariensis TaxID=137265 RepID=A0A1H3S4P3_9ACTN|nr:PLP-dependent aminotransferase family protein [Asanoa ishikariensis]GIF66565.1 GntR family transcriptional regulator [Asanoa ishikariensis]SDZ32109.1 transcriptional regulator, GntR family [Asanoa ishikariensis]